MAVRELASSREFQASHENSYAEDGLRTSELRRALLNRAVTFQRLSMVGGLTAVVALFAAYLLRLFSRVRVELAEAQPPASAPR